MLARMSDDRRLHELRGWLGQIRAAPSTDGQIELIVRRPAVEAREVITRGELCTTSDLIGDNWNSKPTSDRDAQSQGAAQLMNARAAAAIAGKRDRWPLAGDQLYVDFDLSAKNVPPGIRLAVGVAEIEVTDEPHLGCGKFVRRFGIDAQKFVNSREGRALNCRGVNAATATIHADDPSPSRGHLARGLIKDRERRLASMHVQTDPTDTVRHVRTSRVAVLWGPRRSCSFDTIITPRRGGTGYLRLASSRSSIPSKLKRSPSHIATRCRSDRATASFRVLATERSPSTVCPS
jgi:hypothetical protein